MTQLRNAHTTRPAVVDKRDDADQRPCAGQWFVYDALIDFRGGPAFRSAIRAAREMCGTCPAMAACLRENRDESWARAVITGRSVHTPTSA